MDAVYTMMGVCPQDNLLWDTLTGREHLLFYGRLKGLKGAGREGALMPCQVVQLLAYALCCCCSSFHHAPKVKAGPCVVAAAPCVHVLALSCIPSGARRQ